MKRHEIVLRSFIRSFLLNEDFSNSSVEGFAVNIKDTGTRKRATLYNVQKLISVFSNIEAEESFENLLSIVDRSKSILGYCEIKKPSSPCGDAWEVVMIAGPGRGKIMYGLAYSMSPTGRLVSDRLGVSSSAGNAWNKAFNKGRAEIELDDIDLPVDKRRTPNDPSDDCRLHRDGDYDCKNGTRQQLNYAYRSEGWEISMRDFLVDEHNKAINILRIKDKSLLNNVLAYAGDGYFQDVASGNL